MADVTITSAGHATRLYQAFQAAAKTLSEHVAFKERGGRGKCYTYADANEAISRLAGRLSQDEFAAVPRIGLLSENRPEWAISYLGITAAGKTVVPIDENLKPKEIAHIITDAGLTVVFVSGRCEQSVRQQFPEITLFSFEETSPNGWRHLLEGPVKLIEPSTNDVAVLIYTSGTTGTPKVVMLTHQNLLANLEGVEQSLHFDEHDVFLSVLPLHHTFEATCGFLTPIMSGACIVYARSLKSKEILEDIAANGVTIMAGVPLLFEKMYHTIMRNINAAPWYRRLLFRTLYAVAGLGWKLRRKWGRGLFAPLRAKAGLSTIRMLVSGGAPLPPAISRFFNYIGIDFLQGYGMTETSPVISVNRPDDIQFGSVGLPLPNLEVHIDKPGADGVGEIVVRGASVTPGYLNNAEKTAELIRDGWLHTGDLGRFHGRHLWITGRHKNVIVSAAGKNIYPEELEEKLLNSEYVIEALIFGRRKGAKQGEEVRAVIVPDLEQFRHDFGCSTQQPDLEKVGAVLADVVAAVNKQVADYKRISGFEVQLQEFEKTSTKKIKRFIYNPHT